MQTRTYRNVFFTIGLLLGVVIVGLLFATNPTRLGPFWVTGWFVLLFSALTLLNLGVLLTMRMQFKPGETPRHQLRASFRQALLVAGAACIMLGMSSLHQFTTRDGILVFLIIGLINFYWRARQWKS